MSLLTEYDNINDKKAYFENGHSRINTKEEFDEHFENLATLQQDGEYIFRGCCEAKYKLYTSAQRFWIQNQLQKQGIYYHDFIDRLIENCKNWNNNTLLTFFSRSGINSDNGLAYLSYMQHYNVPTPLLDFTHDPYIGLYFTVEKELSRVSNKEIDHYCSLYIVNTSNRYFNQAIKQFDTDIGLKENIDDIGLKEIDYKKHLMGFPIILVAAKNEPYKIINNINISNQEGLFFFNNNPIKPIEEVYTEEMDAINKAAGVELVEENNYEEKFASCLNIHKSLRSYVLYKLLIHNASDNFVYPDNNQLKKDILKETLEQI